MRWLIDEMFPAAVADVLRAKGHDAIAVIDSDLRGAPDGDVFERAVAEQRIVVTENFADFAALVEQHQANDRPCTPVVFVRKSSFPTRGSLAARVAAHLDRWAERNPDPYQGFHWP